jgi:hypothetical protein
VLTSFWTDQNNYAYTHVKSYGKHHWFSEENFERPSKDAFDPLRKGQVLNLHGGMISLVSGALSDLFGFFNKKHRTEIMDEHPAKHRVNIAYTYVSGIVKTTSSQQIPDYILRVSYD